MRLLDNFAALHFSGSDARNFLQGQLSNDMQLLSPTQSLLTSCNSAQGRVQAILTLVERADGIVAVLPAAIVDTTLSRLRRYVLRSKVLIEDARHQLQFFAATRTELHAQQLPEPNEPGEHREQHGISVLRWRDPLERFLVLQPVARSATDQSTANQPPTDQAHADQAHADQEWLLADIRAGVPQVVAETYESFVAQMLNLDVLNGISFNKGCYTGQEIIARTHFRGAVKRRMFHLQGACPPPAAGSKIFSGDTHAGEVVAAAATQAGCELLAVLSLTQHNNALHLEATPGIVLEKLTLPYAMSIET